MTIASRAALAVLLILPLAFPAAAADLQTYAADYTLSPRSAHAGITIALARNATARADDSGKPEPQGFWQ